MNGRYYIKYEICFYRSDAPGLRQVTKFSLGEARDTFRAVMAQPTTSRNSVYIMRIEYTETRILGNGHPVEKRP